MRAREFINEQGMTISVPINITLPDTLFRPDPTPVAPAPASGVINATIAAPAGDEMPEQAIMIPPLQQHLELAKQQGGRESLAINQIVNQTPEDIAAANESSDQEDDADRILALLKRRRERLDQQ